MAILGTVIGRRVSMLALTNQVAGQNYYVWELRTTRKSDNFALWLA